MSVLLGNGNGTFQGHVDYAALTAPASVATADFNGDGKLDLAVAAGSAGTVSLYLGSGTGTFQKTSVDYPIGNDPKGIIVADLNKDGKMDVAVANNGSASVSVLLGNGDGTLQTHKDTGIGNHPKGLAVADLNADGILILCPRMTAAIPSAFCWDEVTVPSRPRS